MRLLLLLLVLSQFGNTESQEEECTPIYVRWYRVRLNLTARVSGPYSKEACQRACALNEHPARRGYPLACIGFNHKEGPNSLAHDCQIFQADQLHNIDAHAEADDRYSFYWKYCVKTEKVCNSNYHFAFYTDRYMDKIEVARAVHTNNLEECLALCLDESTFICRSVSYNRTDGGCYLSPQNQLSKPSYIRVNNNPNFRIDYYESNCYNNTFTFKHLCKEDGVQVSVESKFPYTGVLYGLYDYFTCRTEPFEQKKFSYFFPFPSVAKNCSDSMRRKGKDMVLEVVVSTDGIEPLYFITPEDLTYQARCPNYKKTKAPGTSSVEFSQKKNPVTESAPLLPSTFQPRPTLTLTTLGLRSTLPFKKPVQSLPAIDSLPRIEEQTRNHEKEVRGTRISIKFPLSSGKSVTEYVPNTTTTTPRNTQGIYIINDNDVGTTRNRYFYTAPTYFYPRKTTGRKTSTTLSSTTSSSSTTQSTTDRTTTTAAESTTAGTTEAPLSTTEFTTTTAQPTTTTQLYLSTTTPLASTTLLHTTDAQTTTSAAQTTFENTIAQTDAEFSTSGIPLDSIDRVPASTSRSPTIIEVYPPTTPSRHSPSVKSYTLPPRTVNTKLRIRTTTPTTTPQPPAETTTRPTTTTTSSTSTTSTTTTTQETTTVELKTPSALDTLPATTTKEPESISTESAVTEAGTTTSPQQPILFDIFHGGRAVEAVVVGSKITMTFTPFYPVPPAYMTVAGCQVEPVGSLYDWEREPLPIVKDGCQADNVGLVCPPEKTNFGIRILNEAFRYQSTATVLFTCLIRVCPFAPCPQTFCPAVDGCVDTSTPLPAFVQNLRRRYKRQNFGFPQAPLLGNTPQQFLLGQRQINLPGQFGPVAARPPAALQQYLLALAGDHVVSKQLIVVNSENELGYYLRTGSVPNSNLAGLYGRRK